MRYLSVCSGIEAATCAWHPLGWESEAFSEIEKFPSAVLAHHYPDISNLGDMTQYKEWSIGNIDVLVGGTPCQSFSVAGLRKGLDDPRGNLCLVYLGLAERFSPRWILWENVPGVLSSGGGRDFGAFLGALAQLGYGWAYRVLDAQYCGVPQRRRRVFVVGYLGDWRRAAAVLFERHSLSGHPPPSREKRQETTGDVASCLRSGGLGTDFDCDGGLIASGCFTQNTRDEVRYVGGDGQIAGALADNAGMKQTNYIMAHGQGGAEIRSDGEPSLTCNHEAPIVFNCNARPDEMKFTQEAVLTASQNVAVAFSAGNSKDSRSIGYSEELAPPLRAGASGTNMTPTIMRSRQVRRLTPKECERLQGFPDDYTNIPWRKKPEAPDGPRYKSLGNSMAVPIMRWLGERIQAVDEL